VIALALPVALASFAWLAVLIEITARQEEVAAVGRARFA
jgi:hypothetical protein